MKRRYKVLLLTAGTLAVAVIGLRLVLSHDSPCGSAPPLAAGETPMKGWVHRCYGGPDIVVRARGSRFVLMQKMSKALAAICLVAFWGDERALALIDLPRGTA